ncbi:MAG: hypothetical protein HQ556_01730 [Candidatus Marinimicrobia bacterium]|nr:hypothetical protein [Candidatus Neomarinimicrobiota bacterium]
MDDTEATKAEKPRNAQPESNGNRTTGQAGDMKKLEDGQTCRDCGSSDIVLLVYGTAGTEMIKETQEGKIALGGCVVTGNDPAWRCRVCNNAWGNRSER